MSQECLTIMLRIALIVNWISIILNTAEFIRYRKQYSSLSTKLGDLKKELLGNQQQLAYYKSRCYGAEKKAELLEEELTKLKIKK